MRIGELAEITGASPRALRNYESAGLIRSERADNGYRVYGVGTAGRVRNIRHLLDAGLTLADVQCFRACLDGDMTTAPPSPEGLRIARERLAVIDARIAAQTAARDRLARALEAVPAASGVRDRGGRGGPARAPSDARRAVTAASTG
ncbi:MerR family transcriptional regulator [Streptomyces sp. CT34]|uniref:MerR family transcriptional regulator n=1 Tax=Streptomyces sp. CT34 TaxID=1553907 RepID=UPI00099D35A2|nr:MerR family transcriptional regulator [Streptomyces sp. CT34]